MFCVMGHRPMVTRCMRLCRMLPVVKSLIMTNPTEITLDTLVEIIVQDHPKAVGWLVHKGIICVVCGEPFWGTLGELMERKNIKNPDKLLTELHEFMASLDGD